MNNTIRHVWLASIALASICGCRAGPETPRDQSLTQLQQLIANVATQPEAEFLFGSLRVEAGDVVDVWYYEGVIPGTSGGGENDARHLLLHSADAATAVLVSTPSASEVQFRILDAFVLERREGQWTILEGHGGLGTYEAVKKFVSQLESQPPERVVFP